MEILFSGEQTTRIFKLEPLLKNHNLYISGIMMDYVHEVYQAKS
jgi:hypothetical protein